MQHDGWSVEADIDSSEKPARIMSQKYLITTIMKSGGMGHVKGKENVNGRWTTVHTPNFNLSENFLLVGTFSFKNTKSAAENPLLCVKTKLNF